MENSSIFQPYQKYENCRGDRQIMLKTSIGRQLPYFVNFKKSTCQIFDLQEEKITHAYSFPDSFRLVDVDYFPTKEGHFGILLALEDPRWVWGAENFLLAMTTVPNLPKLKITHSAKIPQKITTIKTLFSLTDMSQNENLGLYKRLNDWGHVVAVGCQQTNCYLVKLQEVQESSEYLRISEPPPQYLLNLLKSFIIEETGIFRYTQETGDFRDYPASEVFVSALSLMPRSRTLMVGLSMGGILAAALNPSNQMTLLDLRHERLIRRIAPLEPEDDPDKFEYFIAAVDRSPRHPIMIQLWRGSFKSLETIKESEKYDRPFFTVCLEHKIPFGESWISVNSIVSERSESTFGRTNKSALESMLNVSQSFGAAKNRNSVLLTYQKRVNDGFHVEGAIFDMDAWYYKRVPGRVTSDGTVLRQSPFLSCIKSEIPAKHVTDIGILTLDSLDVSRFSSLISDADQLFYPSALSYERVFVAEGNGIRWMKIQNLQDTILQKCASKLPFLIQHPDQVAAEILAAGIVKKNVLSPNSSIQEDKNIPSNTLQDFADLEKVSLSPEQKILLNAMFYYGKVEELCDLASRKSGIKEDLKREIAEWAVQEAIDYKRTISDKTAAIFEGSQSSLSPLAEDAVLQGIKLFRVIHEFLKTCSRNVEKEFSGRMRTLASSVKCLKEHTKLVSQFIGCCMVPVDWSVQERMREEHEKRKLIALRRRTCLPVQFTIRSMHRLSPNAQFWNDTPNSEWFPPTPMDLLESILNVNIPDRIKREILVQYVIDWLRVKNQKEFTQKEMAIEVIKVMTNQMLDVDLEKIYYLMDQERDSLNDKPKKDALDEFWAVEDEHYTYEKLWNGQVTSLSQYDLERFERRMKRQVEGGKAKLPILDEDSEKLYQLYLFGREKYTLMSQEAVDSNEFVKMFLSNMKNNQKSPAKTKREMEIEESVKNMIKLNKEKDEEMERRMLGQERNSVYAQLADRFGRRNDDREEEEMTWSSDESCYVPPTAKRIPNMGNPFSKSPDSPVNDSQQIQQNNELNALIATPARYYKKPIRPTPGGLSINTDLLSPTATSGIPMTQALQCNSILKTAKAHQSPGRGRIRFHESTRKGLEEQTEEVQEDEIEEEEAPKLNFEILEDEEEESMTTSRRSLGRNEGNLKSSEDQESDSKSEGSDSEDVEMNAQDAVLEAPKPSESTDSEEIAIPSVQEAAEASQGIEEEAMEAPKSPKSPNVTSEIADSPEPVVSAVPESTETTDDVIVASEVIQEASEPTPAQSENVINVPEVTIPPPETVATSPESQDSPNPPSEDTYITPKASEERELAPETTPKDETVKEDSDPEPESDFQDALEPMEPEVQDSDEAVEKSREATPEPDDGVIRTCEVQEDSDEDEPEDVQKPEEEAQEAPKEPEDVGKPEENAPEEPKIDLQNVTFELQQEEGDDDEADTPSRRTRSRSRSQSVLKDDAPSTSTARGSQKRGTNTTGTSSSSAKRRGRPSGSNTNTNDTPKKRGRPPKTPMTTLKEDDEGEESDEEVVPKKKGKTVDAPGPSGDPGPYPDPREDQEGLEETPKKGRGRPRKTPKADTPGPSGAPDATPKKRGRPPKSREWSVES